MIFVWVWKTVYRILYERTNVDSVAVASSVENETNWKENGQYKMPAILRWIGYWAVQVLDNREWNFFYEMFLNFK